MSTTPSTTRRVLKRIAHSGALVVVLPAAILTWLEHTWAPDAEGIFSFFAQLLACAPGYPGLCLRRAFYVLTLDRCSAACFIGFGALFTHRHAQVEEGVYIGAYSLIGCVTLGRGCLIGSQVSILSGGALHMPDPLLGWTPFDPSQLKQVRIGDQVWIGERCVVVADMAPRSFAAAGSVVSAPVPAGVMVAGNPARFVRRVHPVPLEPAEALQSV